MDPRPITAPPSPLVVVAITTTVAVSFGPTGKAGVAMSHLLVQWRQGGADPSQLPRCVRVSRKGAKD